jgi:PglZ domain
VTDTVISRLVEILDSSITHNDSAEIAPVAVLWPDEDRQWEEIIPMIRPLRSIFTLGPFDNSTGSGPAIWLRCIVAGMLLDDNPDGSIPIIYLPGVSMDEFRSDHPGDRAVQPLIGLQHRSNWFRHVNGRDWTIRALLSNSDVGFGLNVADDGATSRALVSCISLIADEPISRFTSRNIDAMFLNNMRNPDPTRSLLNWLSDPIGVKQGMSAQAWEGFVQQCENDHGFNPDKDGELKGIRLLGNSTSSWGQVWSRFSEAPLEYPGIIERLRSVQPEELVPTNPGAWPGLSELAEENLRNSLLNLRKETSSNARKKIVDLEDEVKKRRGYVWAELGMTPLAFSLEHLAFIANESSKNNKFYTVEESESWYSNEGWRVDSAAVKAVAEVQTAMDIEAVSAALDVIYRPWLDQGAFSLQKAIGPAANAGTYGMDLVGPIGQSEAVVFVDGLRLDLGNLLAAQLVSSGLNVHLTTAKVALPTVTQTSKPTLVPIDQSLLADGDALDARRAPDGPKADVQVLRSLMADAKIQVLGPTDLGDVSGSAWTEVGEIDKRGHELGTKVASRIPSEVQGIAQRIEELIEGGWSKVTVVTDHGWLFMPGGLPKNGDLSAQVTEVKKGRCARIKPGSDIGLFPTVPWHWNQDVRIAIAPGISCFEINKTYEHGGVSPQECFVPRLVITQGERTVTVGAAITSSKWRGLALVVEFSGLPQGSSVDLRTTAGQEHSSIVETRPNISGEGKVILLVGDEDLEGQDAELVVIAADGTMLLQSQMVIGQNR